MKKTIITFTLMCSFIATFAQKNFTSNPKDAKFVTEDFDRFWECFDQMDHTDGNPFTEYVNNATDAFKPLLEWLLDADEIFETAKTRKEDYLKTRNVLDNLESEKERIITAYTNLKEYYPSAKFPPIYFVVGVFSSGGTITDKGLIIGSEKLGNLDNLLGLASHELIHFQQRLTGEDNLLKQSINEGSADFIGELISGKHINEVPFNYGNTHEVELCKEFVKVMNGDSYMDWLYETSGKDDRPNDLGYWIGYKIVEAYYNKQEDKKQAIHDIINIKDPLVFLNESGYLDKYISK